MINNPIQYSDPSGHDYCDEDGNCHSAEKGWYLAPGAKKWNYTRIIRSGYSNWEAQIISKLYEKGGREGRHSADYIMKHSVHIKVGEPYRHVRYSNGGFGFEGDYQSTFSVGAWYEDNYFGNDWVILNPNSGFEAREDLGLVGIAFVAHEAYHLEQGSALRNSVLGEWQAYQFGVNVKLNMGGAMSSEESAVMQKTTLEGYYEEVQKQYPGYMIKLLPMHPQKNIFLRIFNSCVFRCP